MKSFAIAMVLLNVTAQASQVTFDAAVFTLNRKFFIKKITAQTEIARV